MEETIQDRIERSAQHVFDVCRLRVSAEDLERIEKAYRFAAQAHQGQKRNSGEPYITHPIAVANILAEELELGANPVIAAFLHDVVEDTPHTVEEIRALFGDDVAFLVDVVTKRKKEKYQFTKQIDNYKQILDSVHYDVRALLVKLADRLHNMRTLDSMRPDKQMKIAGETDFFYAPLAGRLGLYHVKSELANLSFRYRCPREYEIIGKQLSEDKIRTVDTLAAFTTEIDRILAARGIKARTMIRYRKPYNVWRNMLEDGCDFSHVPFKHYVRVIYTPAEGWSEKDTSLFIYSTLSDHFLERPGSVVNYMDHPKENGYQSFHVKFLNSAGAWEELHIASERMHRNSRLGCVVNDDEHWLEHFGSLLRDLASSSSFFMEGVSSSLYNEDIIAFTPKGKGILLPKGATALDFAYEVHTRIGQHAQYARVNGKLCSLSTELHRGDCVEIGISDDVRPNPQWLDSVKTYKAKKGLHEKIKGLPSLPFNRCESCDPLPGDEVIGIRDKKTGEITVHSRSCPLAIQLASADGDSLVSVSFPSQTQLIFPVRIKITAVDRYHLLSDILSCFVEERHMSVDSLETHTEDQIVTCTIDFCVHSFQELQATLGGIANIDSVDEVQRVL